MWRHPPTYPSATIRTVISHGSSSCTDIPVREYYRVLRPLLWPCAISSLLSSARCNWLIMSCDVPPCIVPGPRDDSRCTTVLSHRCCKPRGIIKQPAYGGVISRKLSARGHAARARRDEIWPTLSPGSKRAVILRSSPEVSRRGRGTETIRRGIDFTRVFHSDKLSVSTSPPKLSARISSSSSNRWGFNGAGRR